MYLQHVLCQIFLQKGNSWKTLKSKPNQPAPNLFTNFDRGYISAVRDWSKFSLTICFQDWQLDTKLMKAYSSFTYSSNTFSWLQLPLVHTPQLVATCSTTHHHFEFVKQTWKIQLKLFKLSNQTCHMHNSLHCPLKFHGNLSNLHIL